VVSEVGRAQGQRRVLQRLHPAGAAIKPATRARSTQVDGRYQASTPISQRAGIGSPSGDKVKRHRHRAPSSEKVRGVVARGRAGADARVGTGWAGARTRVRWWRAWTRAARGSDRRLRQGGITRGGGGCRGRRRRLRRPAAQLPRGRDPLERVPRGEPGPLPRHRRRVPAKLGRGALLEPAGGEVAAAAGCQYRSGRGRRAARIGISAGDVVAKGEQHPVQTGRLPEALIARADAFGDRFLAAGRSA